MERLLEAVAAGVAFNLDRKTPPAKCSYIPNSQNDLTKPTALTYEDLDRLVANGLVEIVTYNGYANVIFSYAGRKKYLDDGNKWKLWYPGLGGTWDGWKRYYRRYLCCDQAIPANCVCLVSTHCPDHGRRCNGSHD